MLLPATACLLTGWWCCELTNLTQIGSFVETTGVYGTGSGSFDGYNLTLQFSNLPPDQLLTATVNPGCDTLHWDDGTLWTRTTPPPPTPSPPAWASTLSILELNALSYTSPNGTGPGDGSGTWASLMPKVAYWKQLGIKGIWLAYYNLVTRHFYGIRSVYAAIDPPVLDPGMGTEAEFKAFVDACHAADVKVFLDVIGHGLVNESHYIQENPSWFAGGSWGMVDYNYSDPEFRAWWVNVWVTYALKFNVDGYRIDIADSSWWSPAWYEIINATNAGGHPIAVWGEGSRFHFSQHDFYAKDVKNVAATKPLGCFNTIQFSCHDSGWESPPGDYFFLNGSRSQFGLLGALSPFIPLWLGGDEAWEAPVVDLPLLQQDLFGQSGKPGGWMYGSVRQWGALQNPTSPASLMAHDVATLLGIQQAHGDVLSKDTCGPSGIAEVPCSPPPPSGGPTSLVPYVRFLPAVKAVVVVGNGGATPATLTLALPLDTMGFTGKGPFMGCFLYGGDGREGNFTLTESELKAFPAVVPGDFQAGGGVTVLLLLVADAQ